MAGACGIGLKCIGLSRRPTRGGAALKTHDGSRVTKSRAVARTGLGYRQPMVVDRLLVRAEALRCASRGLTSCGTRTRRPRRRQPRLFEAREAPASLWETTGKPGPLALVGFVNPAAVPPTKLGVWGEPSSGGRTLRTHLQEPSAPVRTTLIPDRHREGLVMLLTRRASEAIGKQGTAPVRPSAAPSPAHYPTRKCHDSSPRSDAFSSKVRE
jgi:hypothetical protein